MHEVREIHALLDGDENVLEGDTVTVRIEGTEALDLLADAAASMSRITVGYASLVFALGEHQIGLGPCTEAYTMDKILNMSEARAELAAHGHATVRMRLARHIPAVRYLGGETKRRGSAEHRGRTYVCRGVRGIASGAAPA
ncbi:hypothetical protein RFN57_03420 [Streptomyces violaceochromogenes]|uniref:Uncharacterized protein n=1 Tax=Streptomyces violaceochromogenes TaxID=67377 RepID=A0ABU6LPS2_9ACTN|nr:hypothetical protein [Streptomyces violaceochromogenes]MEC7051357.1 hypothetical protein [Streptomyces violaceochromogenes]GHC94283.1 hypothetical protein GCM10010309_79540 [Streptomyces violaceochromogenes]